MASTYLTNLLGNREKIILKTHQHWFVLLRAILFELILIIATLIAITLVWLFWLPQPAALLGYLLLLIPLTSLVRDFLTWHNHEYVVTSRRVIQIFGIFNKNVTDSSLEKVNDVKMDQSALGRMFNYGDIEILTASELGINRFTSIGDPIGFKTAMINAKFQLEKEQSGSSGEASIMDVPRLIQELDELCRKGLISEAEFQQKKARLLARI